MPGMEAIFADALPAERARLIALYEAASKKLREIALHPTGTTTAAQEFRSAAAIAKLRQVDEIVRLLKRETAKAVGKVVSRAATAGAAVAKTQIRKILDHAIIHVQNPNEPTTGTAAAVRESLTGSFNVVNHDAVRVVAQDMAGDLYSAADGMGKTASSILRRTAQEKLSEKEIDDIVQRRVISGDRTAAIRELETQLIAAHEGRIIPAGSRNFDARTYAEMVVRTKTAEAVTKGQLIQYDREGIDLVTIDGKFSDNFCTAFLGQVYSVSGTHPKYPPLSSLPSGGPPFHPNCSKGISAFVEELATPAQAKAAEPDPDANQVAAAGSPAEAQRAFKDLQQRQAAQQRLKGVVPMEKR